MKKIIEAEGAPRAVGPYSHAVRVENLVFTSGQVPIDPGTGKLVEGDFDAQVRRVMENLRTVLMASGTDFSGVVKATVFLDDLRNFGRFNKIYSEYFPHQPPARSAFQVAALPLGAMVEVEMIAFVA
ncbi:MAG: RidA family protein [Deltaproteobacteria bacterium]|nr:RidA family protein [Deltaproteobacteria bacterium]MBW1923996.1 RidA family protein [Deltaproteobacteria bacterium]MBW1948961.1 RidA family protein [Deltaproteobacteria bacterium]MBW2009346.1 RidA family protein [Deltaproteobacteria bacterium]MBW2103142.1 RidA family protein [Deltaproteobacteria bacterium]